MGRKALPAVVVGWLAAGVGLFAEQLADRSFAEGSWQPADVHSSCNLEEIGALHIRSAATQGLDRNQARA